MTKLAAKFIQKIAAKTAIRIVAQIDGLTQAQMKAVVRDALNSCLFQ
jgi:hypothetical protein